MKCNICPHFCELNEGQAGLCKTRICVNNEIICANYGLISSIAVDPIEKKPLYRFHPGSSILSVGSYGCNMSCSFCQNSGISQCTPKTGDYIPPQALVEIALSVPDNIGVAFTYNEPLVSCEYLTDCAPLLQKAGLKVVLVTNGLINEQPLRKLLLYIDAMNIDLKAFSESFYKKHGGDFETVKNTIKIANEACHIEVTTLVIPGENDTEEEITAIAKWLASVNKNIPYHISRFFPNYKYTNVPASDVAEIYEFAKIARKYLNYVYTGNC
ncbi:MAG: AmmeMemoRadiSam system radical SAM enzyme [Oscillospiraceae bacterium]|jgi:pyruvate formate lyase activating enzyme|nr:AmmeMemoRadiSam system radical SAM enzyme [Oscillospiraceae bacterium]